MTNFDTEKIVIHSGIAAYMRMFKHNPKPTDVIRVEDVEKMLLDFGEKCFKAGRARVYVDTPFTYDTFNDYLNYLKKEK